MNTTGNTVLITGGATGIGLALAETLVNTGNEVIICGRREQRLKAAKARLPGLHIKTCDVTSERDRESLFSWIREYHNKFNILINNAGIQSRIDLLKTVDPTAIVEDEILTNLTAPVLMSTKSISMLEQKEEAAIINVSSGLGFVPAAGMPIYSATKAALHSFTLSLRWQLRNTSIKVFEIVPPAVDTELGVPLEEKDTRTHGGIPAIEVSRQTMDALARDEYEILIGGVNNIAAGARTNFEEIFTRMNPK